MKESLKKILVVEDKELILEGLVSMLELENYKVEKAYNGKEALAIAKKNIPDLILSDINMPVMNGFELLKEIKNFPPTNHIPVIFLSGNPEVEAFQKGLNMGADHFLLKPCPPELLINTIERRIKQNESAKESLKNFKRNVSMAIPHEMRTPLNAILGFSQYLMKEENNIEKKELIEIAENVYKSGKRLHKLVEKYIVYANLEMVTLDKNMVQKYLIDVPVNLQNLLEISIFEKRFTINHSLKTEIDQVSYPIKEDVFRIILEELLENAIKFSFPDSEITIRLKENDSWVILEIINSGHGMTKEQIERIGGFVQFERDKNEQQGMGLGLEIVKKILSIYNGKLTIESERDKLTTVSAKLPLQKVQSISEAIPGNTFVSKL